MAPAPVSLYGLTKRAAETLLPRVAETQGVRFAAARLGSVYGPWEYATGVRDTLSPMLQALECARRGEDAVLGPAWRGDFIFSRDVADGLVRLADAPALSRTVYNLGSGRLGSAETWCEALARGGAGISLAARSGRRGGGTWTATPGSTAARWRSARSRGIPDTCRSRGLRRQRRSRWDGRRKAARFEPRRTRATDRHPRPMALALPGITIRREQIRAAASATVQPRGSRSSRSG